MGGIGSGRRRQPDRKLAVEEVCRLNIRDLNQSGHLDVPGCKGTLTWPHGWHSSYSLRFTVGDENLMLLYLYRNGNDSEYYDEVVSFSKTSCHFGGYRVWFMCPCCRRRVSSLYDVSNRFLCRHCHKLTYTSQREEKVLRLIRRSRNIRRQLGAPESITAPIRYKPKGMHWVTFNNLRNAGLKASEEAFEGLASLWKKQNESKP